MTLTRFTCAPNVVWSVERRGIRLLNLASQASQWVPYPEAAIWDLLCRKAPHIPEKIAALAGLPSVEADRLVSETVERWVRDDYLTEREC